MAVQQILGKYRIETIPDAKIVASQLALLKPVMPVTTNPIGVQDAIDKLKALNESASKECTIKHFASGECFDVCENCLANYELQECKNFVENFLGNDSSQYGLFDAPQIIREIWAEWMFPMTSRISTMPTEYKETSFREFFVEVLAGLGEGF